MKGNYLITTDNWFYAPDGQLYRSVFGNVEILKDSILGVETNRNSTNWFLKVGTDENHVIIAGCQIHYAVKTNNVNFDDVIDFSQENLSNYVRPSHIYKAI
jgi:hypothetical protein